MTILFLSRLFFPHIGGVEKHIFEISKRLLKKGYKIILITEQYDRSLPLHEFVHDIEVYRISPGKNDWFKKFRLWKEMFKLRHLIQRADIVHCHDVFFWYLPFRLLHPYKPVYTIFHGYESFPIRIKTIVIRKISELLSWGNICVGAFIQKWYHTNPTYVTYGGVDMLSKHPSVTRIKSAVFIGRVEEQTGILDYAAAVSEVKKSVPAFTFLVVGDGSYASKMPTYMKVLGFQKYPEKYVHASRFVFASGYLSILEAMAAKRLVFALYDNPVKEDYLKMAPFAEYIIIEKTPGKLAEKVLYYLQHPKDEQTLVDKGFAWVQTQTWDHVVSQYETLWKRKK